MSKRSSRALTGMQWQGSALCHQQRLGLDGCKRWNGWVGDRLYHGLLFNPSYALPTHLLYKPLPAPAHSLVQSPTVSQLSLSSSMHGMGGAAPAASATAESQVRQAGEAGLERQLLGCCFAVLTWQCLGEQTSFAGAFLPL